MSEKDAYKFLRDKVFLPRDRLDRVENIVGDGMPDTNYCIAGVEGWIELKSPTEPKRASTPLFGSNHKLLQTQKNWILEQLKAKGIVYLFIATNKRKMLVEGRWAEQINDMTVQQIIDIAKWHRERPRKDCCVKLRDCLIAPF